MKIKAHLDQQRSVSETTKPNRPMMQMQSLSLAGAMHVLCFLNVLLCLLCKLLSTLFQSVKRRYGIDDEGSTKLGSDLVDAQAKESLLFSEDEAKQGMMRLSSLEKCASDESAEFELPAIARVSDVEMETEYPVSVLFLKHADESPKLIATENNGTANGSKFDQWKELQQSPPKRSGSDTDSDSDSEFGFAAIQRQLKMVQKLKMDHKPAKGQILPTILEDREASKVVEDMKPLKLNNKMIDHKGLLEQVHSFHKVYADKMHKLDVLNQQTLTALSFMGLNGEAQDDFMQKKRKKMLSVTVGAMRSAFSVKYLCARVSCDEAEALKSSGGLMSKLELIYVGQLCLSWEILNWQYSRAVKLQALDLQASHLYNQAADEFKQFQVALQIFVENEAPQGSTRVRNYIEKRAAFSGFLQVPLIKDDCLKDKKFNKGECFVTISTLVKIIGECRRVLYEFLREKKQGGTTKVVPRDQSSEALFVQAQAKLHKKKKVMELKRRKGGIVKMICHVKEQPWLDQELFDARVELKLLARVLRMSEISRDQILWCHRKLDEIKLIERRLNIEPTFLLFPC